MNNILFKFRRFLGKRPRENAPLPENYPWKNVPIVPQGKLPSLPEIFYIFFFVLNFDFMEIFDRK